MAKAKTPKTTSASTLIEVGLYGNFKKGKAQSKFLDKVEIIGDCQTLQPYLLYNGLGGISKLHNINAGKCIKLQKVSTTHISYESLLKHFNMSSHKVKTTIGLLEVPMQKSNDLDLTFINEGYYDGE